MRVYVFSLPLSLCVSKHLLNFRRRLLNQPATKTKAEKRRKVRNPILFKKKRKRKKKFLGFRAQKNKGKKR